MTTEQPKTAPAPEHSYAPIPAPYYAGGPYPPPPPGAYPPPFFAYPPPPDGTHGEANGGPPGHPYMMAFHPPPPGMVYAFPHPPPGQGYPASPPAPSSPSSSSRPKRRQVKMACTNCAAACKRCDEQRPCERCMKYGIADSCVDGQRKERKKGIKRGPYKRKNKSSSDEPSYEYGQPPEGGEWSPVPHPAAATTSAAIHAVAQYATPEGYYPVYYPPPGTYAPQMPDGQLNPDGSAPNGHPPPPVMPYYIGGYPPYPHPAYPHPGVYPPHLPPPPPPGVLTPQQSIDPNATTTKKPEEEEATSASTNGLHESSSAEESGKKKRTGKDGKTKKAKGSGARAALKDVEGAEEGDGDSATT